MYLEHIHIQRFKRIRDLELNFCQEDGRPRMWTVLIAPNACGKTSVLQAIALTAVGRAEVNNLANEVREHVVDQRSEEPMRVAAKWRIGEEILLSTASLARGGLSYQASAQWEPVLASKDDPLEQARSSGRKRSGLAWFAAAYGVHRFVAAGRPQAPKQPSVERLRTVFDPSAMLQGPWLFNNIDRERALQFAQLSQLAFRRVQSRLAVAKTPATGEVQLELRGQGGVQYASDIMQRRRFGQVLGGRGKKIDMPLTALSHGLQSLLALVLDILGQFASDPALGWLDRPVGSPKVKEQWASSVLDELSGVVLIDELDLHLHPSWQVGVVHALRSTFPKLQFIVTTHSPVVLAQVAPSEIVRLDAEPGTGDVTEVAVDRGTGELKPKRELTGEQAYLPDPREMTAGELMQSLFGLTSTYPNPNGALIREWRALAEPAPRSLLAIETADSEWERRRAQVAKELRKRHVDPDKLL